ncbi:hypothetical protein [Saccharospirillum sp.]|uniref:hypothetical protein n=1 Tax=Saccharospirillum sp. TaxID=2033801 RepID=UPI0034A03ABF
MIDVISSRQSPEIKAKPKRDGIEGITPSNLVLGGPRLWASIRRRSAGGAGLNHR